MEIKNLVVKHMEVISTARPLESVMTKPGSHRTVDDHGQCVHLETELSSICADSILIREKSREVPFKTKTKDERDKNEERD